MARARSVQDAIAGGIRGLVIGDPLGVPHEFRSGDLIGELETIDMPPPPDYPRAHRRAPPQAWSDDGAQALSGR